MYNLELETRVKHTQTEVVVVNAVDYTDLKRAALAILRHNAVPIIRSATSFIKALLGQPDHYLLHCFVLIDLKTRQTTPGDVGQMNMYLNYFAEEENSELENPPVGIVLGTKQNNAAIGLALGGITNNLLVTKYETLLPLKAELEAEIQRVLEEEE
jgi:hypothetical protein